MTHTKKFYGIIPKEASYSPEWWGYEFFNVSHRSGDPNHSAESGTDAGLSMGYDLQGSLEGIIGFAGGYEYKRITHPNDDRGIVNATIVYTYGMQRFSDFYLDAVFLGAYDAFYEQHHHSGPGYGVIGTSSWNNFQFTSQIGCGYDLYFKWALIEPFALFDFVFNFQSGYEENHAGIHNGSQPANFSSLLFSQAGVRFYQSLRTQPGILAIKEFVAYRGRTILQRGTNGADVLGGEKFIPRFYTGVEFEIELLSHFHWTLQYNLELGNGLISQGVQTTLAKAF